MDFSGLMARVRTEQAAVPLGADGDDLDIEEGGSDEEDFEFEEEEDEEETFRSGRTPLRNTGPGGGRKPPRTPMTGVRNCRTCCETSSFFRVPRCLWGSCWGGLLRGICSKGCLLDTILVCECAAGT